MFLLTWDQFTIDSETVRNSSQWIALQLKERFLLGSLLFWKLQNFTPVSLFSPTHAPLHYPPPCITSLLLLLFCQNMPAVQLVFISVLFKKRCAQSRSGRGAGGKLQHLGFFFFSFLFWNMKCKMLNRTPLNVRVLPHCGHTFNHCTRIYEKTCFNSHGIW